ncbi:MAG: hypothetical protein ACOCPN_01945 [Desulfonatronovibrionaceae bacterium]
MTQEKIKPVGQENPGSSNPVFSHEDLGSPRSDMGKAGVIISVLAVVLLVVFYYSVNKNMDHLSQQVGLIEETRDRMQELDSRVTSNLQDMDQRIKELEKLPQVVRSMILGSMLEEMGQKTSYIEGQVSDKQKDKLEQARKLMNEVQQELAR